MSPLEKVFFSSEDHSGKKFKIKLSMKDIANTYLINLLQHVTANSTLLVFQIRRDTHTCASVPQT